MPNIHEKPPAELENQLIDYLLHDESIPDNIRFHNMGALARHLLAIEDLDTISSNPELRANNPADLDKFAKGFAPHLRSRSHDPESLEHREGRVRMIACYNDEFAPLVAAIDFTGDSSLRDGTMSTPRTLEKDGVEYIVRQIKPLQGVQQVEKHIEAGLRVADIDHMEHIIAISYKDGITIAPKLPGASFKELERSGNAKDVSEAQLREFVTCMKQADERGIKFDGQGENIFYDTQKGFSALDLEPLETYFARSWSYALMRQIEDLAETTSGDLDYVYEVDRISAIVEDIFNENHVDGFVLHELQHARKQIAGTIKRLDTRRSTRTFKNFFRR